MATMAHATFHTLCLETLATQVWESGWDYIQGNLYTKEYRGVPITCRLVMKNTYYQMIAAA